MRISVISNGITTFTEYINSTPKPSDTEPVKETDPSEFKKTLESLQNEIVKKINNTTTASLGKITVGADTVNEYQSIAPEEYQDIFKKAAETYGIDQKFLELIAKRESNFSRFEVSKSGAMGIMQLMPGTAEGLGVENPYDPEENIMGGAKLLARLRDAYNGDMDLMISGYNAGMGAVKKYGGVPPYEETTKYIEWMRERYS